MKRRRVTSEAPALLRNTIYIVAPHFPATKQTRFFLPLIFQFSFSLTLSASISRLHFSLNLFSFSHRLSRMYVCLSAYPLSPFPHFPYTIPSPRSLSPPPSLSLSLSTEHPRQLPRDVTLRFRPLAVNSEKNENSYPTRHQQICVSGGGLRELETSGGVPSSIS